MFWSLFNHCKRSQSYQEQCSLCCSSPCFRVFLCIHYWPLQYFSTYSRKLKEIGVLRSIFPDYVISCNYGLNDISFTKNIGWQPLRKLWRGTEKSRMIWLSSWNLLTANKVVVGWIGLNWGLKTESFTLSTVPF